MNAIVQFPLSPLDQERKDHAARVVQNAVEYVVNDPDRRWTDEQLLLIGLSTQALKTFLMRNLPK